MSVDSAGQRFRHALQQECPLQIVGTVNAICAKLALHAGFRCLYLSGSGVAAASLGLPDLGFTKLDDVLTDTRRIAAATELPLLVDCDTGWETTSTISTTVTEMIDAGAAGLHLEDQAEPKRCGHREGKRLIATERMNDRIKAAVDARSDHEFVIMARTDAATDEGLSSAIERANRYVASGADVIFAEALTSLDQYNTFTAAVSAPVLANMTEFGRSPLLTIDQLRGAGVRLVLYPLSIFRTMNAAAADALSVIRNQGVQTGLVDHMQTREQLYQLLDYHTHEQAVDELFQQQTREGPGGRPS